MPLWLIVAIVAFCAIVGWVVFHGALVLPQ